MSDLEDDFELVPRPGRSFTRFTGDARRVVVYSQVLARQQGLDYIDASHLADAATKVLAGETIVDTTPTGIGHIPFTTEAKGALERSLRICRAAKAPEITPEHLLEGATG